MMTTSKIVVACVVWGAGLSGFAQTNTFPSSGSVGIGTTSPNALFEIKGGNTLLMGSNGDSGNNKVYLRGGSVGDKAQIQMNHYGFADYWISVGDAGNGLLSLTKTQGGSDGIIINGSGNVGIGTTSPSGILTLEKDAATGNGPSLEIQNNSIYTDTSSDATRIRLMASLSSYQDTVGVLRVTKFYTPSAYSLALTTNAPGGLAFSGNNSAAHMVINSSGNVGIGTTNPTQKLAVNGSIRAKEVIVDTGWSDFVFDEGYKLKALSEVEAYVKAQKHLPDIPSAQEVKDHGVTLGEMQSKLLAKIEELTLHQIAQEKQLASLQHDNAALHARVSTLEQAPAKP